MNYFQTIRDFAIILLALLVIPALFLRANLERPLRSLLARPRAASGQRPGAVRRRVGGGRRDSSVIEDYVYLVDVKSPTTISCAAKTIVCAARCACFAPTPSASSARRAPRAS